MSNETYRVGVARADITPPVGIRLCGYTVREGVSTSVDQPLTATALVIRGRQNTIVVVAIDLTLATVEMTAQWRQRCSAALGIPAKNVLINFNHTHSAPNLPGFAPHDMAEQLAMQAQFGAYLENQLEKACRDAAAEAKPARFAVGWGECRGNINRRQRTEDGDILLGEDAQGACDSSVGVWRIDDLQGKPIAIAFRYSCHTVTMGPRTNVISPDFAGPARSVVEEGLGCLSLFLQGCAGNINPATGIGQDAEGREDTLRLGQMLGGEVLKVCANLRTHRRRSAPRLVQSVAKYWMYEYGDIPVGEEGSICVQETKMEMPLVPFPPLQEVQLERKEWAVKLDRTRQAGGGERELNVAVRFDCWAQARLDAARAAATNGQPSITVKFPVQTFQLGDFAIAAMPFETMSETGTQLREAVPQRDTFVLGYSNGVVAYLPTAKVSEEGGMEALLGYKNYLLPAAIPGDWEAPIREQALSQLQQGCD